MVRRTYSAKFKTETAKLAVGSSRPLSTVAQEVGVAERTLTNWVKRYREEHDEPVSPSEARAPRGRADASLQPAGRSSRPPSAVTLQRRLMDRERRRFALALDQMEQDGSAIEAAGLVVAARRRFLIGEGKSFAYASLLAGDLAAGVSQVTLVDGSIVRPLDILADVRSSDILVAFSVHPYRRYTIDFARHFGEEGGMVVGVTDDEAAPIIPHADVTIIVPSENAPADDSPSSVVAAIHILGTLVTASAKGARRRQERREKLTRSLDLYWDPDHTP